MNASVSLGSSQRAASVTWSPQVRVPSGAAAAGPLVHLRLRHSQEARQDLVGVLAEEGRGRLGGSRSVPEPDGHAHGGDRPGLGMLDAHEHASRAQVLALAHLGHRLDAAGGHPRVVETLEPFRGRPRGELRVEGGNENVAMLHAVRLGVEARILREVVPADGPAHALPEGVVGHAQGQVGVLGLEDFVGHDGGVLVAAPGGLASGIPVQAGLVGEKRGHHVEHADLDLLPLPRLGAREKGQHHALGRGHARHEIADGVAHLDGRAVGEAGEIHHAGLALHDEIVAGPGGLGAALSEAGDRAVDEPRVQLAERSVAEAEALHGAGTEVLDHHVGLGEETAENGLPVRRLHVEGQALLVAVDRHEIRRLAPREGRPAARVVALARLLDFDDLCPHVAERHGAEGPGEDAGEIDDAKPREGRPGLFLHGGLLLSCRHASVLPRYPWPGSW